MKRRMFALLLIGCMCLPFAACTQQPPPPPPPPETPPTVAGFGGEEFYIAAPTAYAWEIYREEETTVIDQFAKIRNDYVEDKLDVRITPVLYAEEGDAFASAMRRNLLCNNAKNHDMILSPLASCGTLIGTQALYDLRTEVPYVRDVMTEEDGWPEALNAGLTLRGRQYAGLTDINLSAYRDTNIILLNRDVEQNYQVLYALGPGNQRESIYELVEDGVFTVDTMYLIVRNFEGVDDGFAYPRGLLTAAESRSVFASAFSHDLLINDGKELSLSATIPEDINPALGLLRDMFTAMREEAVDMTAEALAASFTADKALFYTATFRHIEAVRSDDREYKLGILPYPKATPQQKAYHTDIQNTATGVLLPQGQPSRLTMTGCTTAMLASRSYDTVRHAYLESILYSQLFGRQNDTFDMAHMILKGRRIGLSHIHAGHDGFYTEEYGTVSDLWHHLTAPDTADAAALWEEMRPFYEPRTAALSALYGSV